MKKGMDQTTWIIIGIALGLLILGILALIASGKFSSFSSFVDTILGRSSEDEINPSYNELPQCEKLIRHDTEYYVDFPANITCDGIFINISDIEGNILNKSDVIIKKCPYIGVELWSIDGNLITHYDERLECEIKTYNRLKELNATDLLEEFCVKPLPQLRRIGINAYFKYEHNVTICGDRW